MEDITGRRAVRSARRRIGGRLLRLIQPQLPHGDLLPHTGQCDGVAPAAEIKPVRLGIQPLRIGKRFGHPLRLLDRLRRDLVALHILFKGFRFGQPVLPAAVERHARRAGKRHRTVDREGVLRLLPFSLKRIIGQLQAVQPRLLHSKRPGHGTGCLFPFQRIFPPGKGGRRRDRRRIGCLSRAARHTDLRPGMRGVGIALLIVGIGAARSRPVFRCRRSGSGGNPAEQAKAGGKCRQPSSCAHPQTFFLMCTAAAHTAPHRPWSGSHPAYPSGFRPAFPPPSPARSPPHRRRSLKRRFRSIHAYSCG